jgi:hypothetical protein
MILPSSLCRVSFVLLKIFSPTGVCSAGGPWCQGKDNNLGVKEGSDDTELWPKSALREPTAEVQ